jgi:hypothetical protein
VSVGDRDKAAAAFQEAVAYAEALQAELRWEEAAHTFARAGALAVRSGASEAARLAWGAAGEAFRRADRIVEASDALRVALSQQPVPDTDRVVLQVRMTGCMVEMGNGLGAIEVLDRMLAETEAPELKVLVADACFGTRLGYGPLKQDALEALLAEIEPNAWAHAFRSAQMLRLAGKLNAADDLLADLEMDLEDVAGAGAGRGGVQAERGEIAALQGDPEGTAAEWARAAEAHRAAGRLSLMWRAEAGRIRSLVDAGLEPLPGPAGSLLDGLSWAAERKMVTLAIDLGLALGIASRDRVRLEQVREQALQFGLFRKAGRAELARAALLEGLARMEPLKEAERHLQGDLPYTLRVRTLRAETLAGVAHGAASAEAAAIRPELEAAGMAPELARIASL